MSVGGSVIILKSFYLRTLFSDYCVSVTVLSKLFICHCAVAVLKGASGARSPIQNSAPPHLNPNALVEWCLNISKCWTVLFFAYTNSHWHYGKS